MTVYLHKVVNTPGRLTYPLIRKNGKLERASWEEAMDLVARRFRETIAAHGPDAVAFYGSGQTETKETYLANKLFKGCLGTNNLEGNPRLCMASAVGGYLTTFGADEPVGSYDDLDHADLFLLIGSNATECHPVVFDRLVARKSENPEVKIIIIDPRQTPTDRIADLQIRPILGYDLGIMHAIARILINEGYTDEKFIGESVSFKEVFDNVYSAGFPINRVIQGSWQEFYRILDEIEGDITQDLTEHEFFRMIAPVVARVGCSHTAVRLSEGFMRCLHSASTFLPLNVKLIEGRAYVVANYSEDKRVVLGSEILAINNEPMPAILAKLLQSLPSDGWNQSYKYSEINRNFPSVLAQYFGLFDRFEIEIRAPEDERISVTMPAICT